MKHKIKVFSMGKLLGVTGYISEVPINDNYKNNKQNNVVLQYLIPISLIIFSILVLILIYKLI